MSTILIPLTISTQGQVNITSPGNTYEFQGNTTITTMQPFYCQAGAGVGTTIDGKGYTLTISGSEVTNFTGLFASAYGQNLNGITIKNFTIAAANGASLGTANTWTAWINSGALAGPKGITLCNILNTAPVTGGGENGVFLGYLASNCRLFNCGNTGLMTARGAGMLAIPINCTASNCYNRSSIPNEGGGIFGSYSTDCSAFNCYSSGSIPDNSSGPIFSFKDPIRGNATNCYTVNRVVNLGTSVIATNCQGGNGTWSDTTANLALTGYPASIPGTGSVWKSQSTNTPYYLLYETFPYLPPPCFLPMTRILTPTGYRTVETLCDYDDVETSDGRAVPIKVFRTHIAKTTQDTAPYVIPRSAIAPNIPDEDLHVSGLHAIQDGNGVWQFPMALSMHKGANVYQHLTGRPATYYHLECPNYFTDNLVANGCVAESFRNKQGREGITFEYCEEKRGFVRNREEDIKDSDDIPSDVLAVYC